MTLEVYKFGGVAMGTPAAIRGGVDAEAATLVPAAIVLLLREPIDSLPGADQLLDVRGGPRLGEAEQLQLVRRSLSEADRSSLPLSINPGRVLQHDRRTDEFTWVRSVDRPPLPGQGRS